MLMVMSDLGFLFKSLLMKKKLWLFYLLGLLTGCQEDPVLPPKTLGIVGSTTPATSITSTTARSGGIVTNSGGSVIMERGICWASTNNPSVSNFKAIDPGGVGLFTSNLTSLTPGTVYYIRAFVTNAEGTNYGNQVIFTTLTNPSIITNNITSITTVSAVGGGSVSSSGGATVTARGVCWSTTIDPTTALSTKTSNGSGTGSFSSSMTGLTTRTTYYVRAYATNSVGTSYGANVTFRTN